MYAGPVPRVSCQPSAKLLASFVIRILRFAFEVTLNFPLYFKNLCTGFHLLVRLDGYDFTFFAQSDFFVFHLHLIQILLKQVLTTTDKLYLFANRQVAGQFYDRHFYFVVIMGNISYLKIQKYHPLPPRNLQTSLSMYI